MLNESVPPHLHDINVKRLRAFSMFEDLQLQVAEFTQSVPYTFVPEINREDLAQIYRARIRDPEDHVSRIYNIRILTGEILYHLRTVLDHLTWQLALLETATPYRQTAFPIYETASDYHPRKGKVKGVPPVIQDLGWEAQALIEDLQPYQVPKPRTHLLSVLNHLCNDDKHRMVHVVAVIPTQFAFAPRRPVKGGMGIKWAKTPIEDGAEVCRLIFANPTELEVEMKTFFNPKLFLVDTSVGAAKLPLLETFELIGPLVEAVLLRFEPFFPA